MKKTTRQMSNTDVLECFNSLSAVYNKVLGGGLQMSPTHQVVFSTIIGKNMSSLKAHQIDLDYERQLLTVKYGRVVDGPKGEQNWAVDVNDPNQYSSFIRALRTVQGVNFPVDFYTITVDEMKSFNLHNTIVSSLWFLIDDEDIEMNMPHSTIDTEEIPE